MDDIRIGDWSKLGATLRTRRLQLGLSQWEVSVQANVSRSWLARIEATTAVPSWNSCCVCWPCSS